MRVAIVHDWLCTFAGSERVLEQMLQVFPQADLFTLVDFLPPAERGWLGSRRIVTSFLQHCPFAKTRYRSYLPLMPLAIEQFDMSGYDLVLSSSHAVAKGVITGPDQIHVSYVYSPIRYAWDLQHQYLHESGLDRGLRGWMAKYLLHTIRRWDVRTAPGVDAFAVLSRFIGRRVRKAYNRGATVIYPPVDLEAFPLRTTKENFYCTASRMVPYKRIDLIVEAFQQMPDKQLVVIGDGPDFSKIRAKAGPNVELLGFQPTPVLADYLQRAKAFLFAPLEDFGIAPLEAQACGTPVIAYGHGGARETILGDVAMPEPTGVFFDEQTVPSLVGAIQTFEAEQDRFQPVACRRNAERFSAVRFRTELSAFVQHIMAHPNAGRAAPGD